MVRISTGVAGLDEVLQGGLIRCAAYLVRGAPGQGKTTLGLHFLSAAAPDERTLFIGFQETEEQLRRNADAIGLDVSDVDFVSLSPDEQFFTEQQDYDVFASAEVEQVPLAETVVNAVERLSPARVFVDSLTQLRFLSTDVFQYRKQVLSFLHYLKERGVTVVFASESSANLPDDDLQFIADGVLSLESTPMGATVRTEKFRGSGFLAGAHQMRNAGNGIEVFPRPRPPAAALTEHEYKVMGCGIKAVDELLGGGLETGTVSMITGPSGIGKSTLACAFVAQTGRQGGQAAVYLFEEEIDSYLHRAKTLKIPLSNALQSGDITIEQVEPMRYLADEFAMKVRQHVDENNIELVVFDSTAGFQLTLDQEDIKVRLHALSKSLSRLGVSVLLVNETEGLTGDFHISEKGISYLSDNVIFLRYMEIDSKMQKVFGILKKRLSDFDRRLHRFSIGPSALIIEGPIHGLGGVLAGLPTMQNEPD